MEKLLELVGQGERSGRRSHREPVLPLYDLDIRSKRNENRGLSSHASGTGACVAGLDFALTLSVGLGVPGCTRDVFWG